MLASPRARGRLSAALIGVALLALLALAACGGSTSTNASPTATTAPTDTATTAPTAVATTPAASGAATISMGSGHFTGNTSVTIKAGQTVVFDDSTGGPHNLVIGMHGAFTAESGAPSQLNNSGGLPFDVGTVTPVVFPNAGTFNITCTFHPAMQATVTVTP